MLTLQKLSFDSSGLFEQASLQPANQATHWLREGSDPRDILDKATKSVDDPASFMLVPTGNSHASRGSEYRLSAMPYRPYAEVSKTTLIPIITAKDERGRKRVYMLLDHKPSTDSKGDGTIKFVESSCTFSKGADSAITHQTHSLQALSLLLEKQMRVTLSPSSVDHTVIEQEDMRASVQIESAVCKAHFKKMVEYRVEGDLRCNRNVVYTAFISPQGGAALTASMLKRGFKVIDCTDEINGSSSSEKADCLAKSFLSRMPTNFLHFKEEALVMKRVFSESYKEIGQSRLVKPVAIACFLAIGLASLFWYVKRSA
jgi:hypothetical protein